MGGVAGGQVAQESGDQGKAGPASGNPKRYRARWEASRTRTPMSGALAPRPNAHCSVTTICNTDQPQILSCDNTISNRKCQMGMRRFLSARAQSLTLQ